jgi:hypothetical protein
MQDKRDNLPKGLARRRHKQMAANLAIPPAIEEVIANFDLAGALLDEHAVKQAPSVARQSLVNATRNVGRLKA